MAIVKYKNTKDVLQGVSKLDYLQKISRFQQYCSNRWQQTVSQNFEDDEEMAADFIVNLETVVNPDGSVSVHHLQYSNYLEIVRYDTDRHSFEITTPKPSQPRLSSFQQNQRNSISTIHIENRPTNIILPS